MISLKTLIGKDLRRAGNFVILLSAGKVPRSISEGESKLGFVCLEVMAGYHGDAYSAYVAHDFHWNTQDIDHEGNPRVFQDIYGISPFEVYS